MCTYQHNERADHDEQEDDDHDAKPHCPDSGPVIHLLVLSYLGLAPVEGVWLRLVVSQGALEPARGSQNEFLDGRPLC